MGHLIGDERRKKFMKPTINNIDNLQRGDSNGAARRGGRFPLTDFGYQSMAGFAGHCGKGKFADFRKISGDYFENEARGTFVTEAGLFALIVATVTVPLVQGASTAIHLLQAIGQL